MTDNRSNLLEPFRTACGEQSAHLGYGDAIERGETFRLWQALADECGVEAFKIGEDDQLFQRT